jgi:predicted dehydrogenase
MKSADMRNAMTRRSFLRTSAAASLTASLITRGWTQEQPKPIRLGVIGVGNRGTYLLNLALALEGVGVTAVCDLDPKRIDQAATLVEKAGGKRPAGFTAGPTDYRRLLAREDVDAVIIATPMQLHAAMSVDALRAGKHVLSEVAAAVTLDECWTLVRAAEQSGRIYMMSENCCYYRQNLMVLQMVRAGLFGDLTFAECGYVHDCRYLLFNADGSLTWRGELARDFTGNLYPTHSLGPVCQWLGVNRGDRLVSLVASASVQKSGARYVSGKFGADSPAAKIKFAVGDTTTTLIRTARGAVIDLRYDTLSARPHPNTTYYSLQGETASYKDDGVKQEIWLESRSKGYAWEPAAAYADAFEHPLWKHSSEQARKTGHGGADYFVVFEFVDAVRARRPAPIDACDAAAWSCIIPLSAASIRAGGAPQDIPDFTRGAWARRKPA